MIKNNRVSKYILYALGEIILVVIGILIALSINTWNETRKNQKEANFQLSKLKDNLNADQAQIKLVIQGNSIYIDNLIFCVKVLSDEVSTSKEEFLYQFQDIYNTSSFSPVRGTFDGLVSSGKIELINNPELLDGLFLYYNSTYYKSWDSAMIDYSRQVFAPYLLNFDHIPNLRPEEIGMNFTQFDFSEFSLPGKSIDAYKNDQFVLNALRMKIQLFEGQQMHYMKLQKNMAELIEVIERELEK